ncbi:hypothetical protein, variant 2 [Blastomyces dermatitidis ATCC 18188]|uniref:Uncharacterized protein n=1 Tax=Ajellomyces dermatitidis (strain ATCC 18188 / CBS 674.68) TaxID=653446 RepID=F2T3X2_AJEDA|nr:hypothetical protein BDDG_01061 [Blastomyces dermatitidis ATCC 18188]KMW66661.1 hypothetical protein, variant 1 [Blastomyces dermatitidis ATCC 18188]KMW66662.1 hypothetical protein, variant 2 [Blastomyces dermatitidis ATCC 18188]
MQSLPTTPDPRTFRWMTNHSYRFNQDTENVDCRRDVGEPELLFNIITDYFITMNISITGTQYWESYAVIVLEHLTSNPNGVPSVIAHWPCYCLFKIEWAAISNGTSHMQVNRTDRRYRPK